MNEHLLTRAELEAWQGRTAKLVALKPEMQGSEADRRTWALAMHAVEESALYALLALAMRRNVGRALSCGARERRGGGGVIRACRVIVNRG